MSVQTHSQACHHAKPLPVIMELAIIQVLMLNESAIQNPRSCQHTTSTQEGLHIPTKFQGPHCRLAGSTGFKSWFVNMSWALDRPGSESVCSFVSSVAAFEERSLAIARTVGRWRWTGNSENSQRSAMPLRLCSATFWLSLVDRADV